MPPPNPLLARPLAAAADASTVRLFIDTGMRVSEMCGVRLEDLDMKADKVTVRGKGDRVRILPFGAKTGTALERWSGPVMHTVGCRPVTECDSTHSHREIGLEPFLMSPRGEPRARLQGRH